MTYEYQIVLSIVAASFGIAGYAIYIRSVLRGITKPHIFTWLIFALVDFIVFAAQLSAGGGPGSFVVFIGAFANSAIVLLALRSGDRDITKLDWICFVLAVLSVVLWRATSEPLNAIVILTFGTALAYIPTFRKSYLRPHEESASIWGLDVLRFSISLLALSTFNLTTALFPASVVFFNSSLVLMLLLQRRALAIKPANYS